MTGRLTATLRIRRGGSDGAGGLEAFEVPYEDGASVLDGLLYVRENADPTLAVRYSCISANVCKECTMLIDGAVQYACVARLKPGVTQLEPLSGKQLLRDLVSATVSPRERPGP